MTAVVLSGVEKSYDGRTRVLEAVDLALASGEICFLLGPSGCGKTTLLRIVAGFLRADAGSVTFDGRDVAALPPERRGIGMVFQNYALWPHLDVAGNVAFALEQQRRPRVEIGRRVGRMLDLVGLAGYERRAVAELSGGQQQRVALARALVAEPGLLLLDEPLSNLDAGLRIGMRGEIRRICKGAGVTALYVTHDQDEALSVADRIAVMRAGRLVQVASPRECYRRPVDAGVARFLGAANLIAAQVVGRDGERLRCRTPFAELACQAPASTGDQVGLCLRPEDLRLGAAAGAVNAFDAEILDETFLGDHSDWRLRTGGLELVASERAAPERAVGSTVRVAIDAERVVVLPGGLEP